MTKRNKIILICSFSALAILFITLIALLFKGSNEEITYTVTFNSDGGSEVAEQIINKGGLVSKPTDPTKEGYIFAEWQYNGTLFDFNTIIEEDIILDAKWLELTDEIEYVTVKFDTDGGTSISNQVIEKGLKAHKPNNPSKDGYNFVGWYYNNEQFDFNNTINENITIVAKWEQVVVNNNPIQNPNTGGNSSNPENNTPQPSEPEVKNNYTVTFNSNGGSIVTSQTIVEGNKATQPENPTRTGYNFTGWTLNGSAYDFNNAVTGNITLVANWTQKNYSVVANKVDNISPARVLTIYEDGNVISVESIQYSDGSSLCSGQNPNVNYYAIEGETSVRLVLSGGTIVNASLTINY